MIAPDLIERLVLRAQEAFPNTVAPYTCLHVLEQVNMLQMMQERVMTLC